MLAQEAELVPAIEGGQALVLLLLDLEEPLEPERVQSRSQAIGEDGFVHLLQADEVGVVSGQLLLQQVLPVVDLQRVRGAVRVQHGAGELGLGIGVGQDVVGDGAHGAAATRLARVEVPRVERARARPGLHGAAALHLAGRPEAPGAVPRRAAQLQPQPH